MTKLTTLKTIPAGLFWSAPLAFSSDFTLEDPLALDYLGQQVGLWLFRGFTTRTARAQNYAVVLYGLHLAEKAVQKYGYPGDDETRTRLFERWERFWALATMEFRKAELIQGDEDAMRGVRGATRAWFDGTKPLPLDFPLISRQDELGGLGAYLTSLREYGLVFPGSLRVTPAANEIIDTFWSEKGERDMSNLYEEYALAALDFENKTISRKHGHLTLYGIGKRSCLSSLVHCSRSKQQQRLWDALFLNARDGSTLPLSERLISAYQDGVNEPELLLNGLLEERWGTLNPEVSNKVHLALAFGLAAQMLLARFNRAYGYLDQHGWVAEFEAVAAAAFPKNEMKGLRSACTAVLETTDSARFHHLQYHGPGLLLLLNQLANADTNDCLEHLLNFHKGVQRARRGGGSWLHRDQGKLTLQVAGYNGYKSDPGFPSFKLNVVIQLLIDLGRLK